MIGIVGGIGPYSGVDLLKKVFDNTIAKTDQQHLDAVLLNLPSKIPDRTEYLLDDKTENPAYAIVDVILKLQEVGATVIGIPCNTAHSEEIFKTIQRGLEEAKSPVKLINMIDETVLYISSNYPKISKIGVLSTTGTYKTGIYAKALQAKRYEIITPSAEIQEKLIHPAIYNQNYGIKANSNPVQPQARKNLMQGISFLKAQGAQAIILGCTEIPLAIPEKEVNEIVLLDPTTILARALIQEYNPDKLKPV